MNSQKKKPSTTTAVDGCFWSSPKYSTPHWNFSCLSFNSNFYFFFQCSHCVKPSDSNLHMPSELYIWYIPTRPSPTICYLSSCFFFLSNWPWKSLFSFTPSVRIRVWTLIFLTDSAFLCFFCFFLSVFSTMETGEKKSPKIVRIPPPRGQVKVRIFKEVAKGVKSAISVARKKLGCSGSSASSSRVIGYNDSKGHSDTWPDDMITSFFSFAWFLYALD